MKRILLDTNAYVAFKQGRPEALRVLQQAPAIALNSIVLGELLCGFATSAREDATRGELEQFLDSPRVCILPLDRRTAEQYASVYVALKQRGTPIPTNDMWIAASAIQHGLDLFSYDGHFQGIQGLRTGKSLPELGG